MLAIGAACANTKCPLIRSPSANSGRGTLRSPRPLASADPTGSGAPPSGTIRQPARWRRPERRQRTKAADLGDLPPARLRRLALPGAERHGGRSPTAWPSGSMDRRTGLVFDYAAKGGVEHAEILAPSHAPDLGPRPVRVVEPRGGGRAAEGQPGRPRGTRGAALGAQPCRAGGAGARVRPRAVRGPGHGGGRGAARPRPGRGRAQPPRPHPADHPGAGRGEGRVRQAKERGWNKVELLEGWREAWARDSNAALERCGALDARGPPDAGGAARRRRWSRRPRRASGATRGRSWCETVLAVSLDRPPLAAALPRRLADEGTRHRGRAGGGLARGQARGLTEVRAIAAGLAREVGAWIAERAASVAERVRERLGPEHQGELALAGSGRGEPEEDRRDLATRLQGGVGRPPGRAGADGRRRKDRRSRRRAGKGTGERPQRTVGALPIGCALRRPGSTRTGSRSAPPPCAKGARPRSGRSRWRPPPGSGSWPASGSARSRRSGRPSGSGTGGWTTGCNGGCERSRERPPGAAVGPLPSLASWGGRRSGGRGITSEGDVGGHPVRFLGRPPFAPFARAAAALAGVEVRPPWAPSCAAIHFRDPNTPASSPGT